MAGIRVAYLTLEAPRQGQASYTHVSEIVEGLKRNGFSVDLYLPSYTNAASTPSILRRMWEYLWLQGRLLARGHYMAFPVALAARCLRATQLAAARAISLRRRTGGGDAAIATMA
jgi:hypothetical protein